MRQCLLLAGRALLFRRKGGMRMRWKAKVFHLVLSLLALASLLIAGGAGGKWS